MLCLLAVAAVHLLLLKLCFSMLMFITGVLTVALASGVTYLAGLADSSENNTDQSGKETFKWYALSQIRASTTKR